MTENAAQKPNETGSTTVKDEPPVAKIFTTKELERFVPLEWPIEFKGSLFEKIRVHRITGSQMQAYIDKLRAPAAPSVPPTIDCPQEVWDAMDADDMDAVGEAAMDFMPRRLKAAGEPTLGTGDSSSAS